MNYFSYKKFDILNGEGARVVLWLTGCSHGCDGCFSPESHNPNYGKLVTVEIKNKILEDLSLNYIKGFTWSGGDPLHKRNISEVIEFSKVIKNKFPDKDIWLYTGFTIDEIRADTLRSPVLDIVDVLIDGKFDRTLPSATFRGSSNQNLIYLK